MKPPVERRHRPKPGQIWSRYSSDGKRRLTGYIVRRVNGDKVEADPISSSGRVIGPRMLFGADFLTRYYLEDSHEVA